MTLSVIRFTGAHCMLKKLLLKTNTKNYKKIFMVVGRVKKLQAITKLSHSWQSLIVIPENIQY